MLDRPRGREQIVEVVAQVREREVRLLAAEGADLSLAKVREWCRPRLAGYKLPRDVVLVDALPRNASGKVVKGELRAAHGR